MLVGLALLTLAVGLPGCKEEKKEPPPEEKKPAKPEPLPVPAVPNPAPPAAPEMSQPAPSQTTSPQPANQASTQSSSSSNSAASGQSPTAASGQVARAADSAVFGEATSSSNTTGGSTSKAMAGGSNGATRDSASSFATKAGSVDRDGKVDLLTIAKAVDKGIDHTRRAFAGGDNESALTEALRARQKLPSPAQVEALGKELGPRGSELASRIEKMRRSLDAALSKLDEAGAGGAPNQVRIPNLTIE